MPRARLTARIEELDKEIARVLAEIETQRGVIDTMRLRGYKPGVAETRLTILETQLARHKVEQDDLRADLAALGKE
jgi:hypothetical protein